MLTTTEGVVISRRDAGDNDSVIKVLSPELGLIEITVKGAKKLTSKNNSSTQLFACSNFCFNERNGRCYLNSSEPKNIFYGLRLDIEKTALASYFAEIVSYTVTERQSARDVYRLFMNCLYMLSEGKRSCRFIKFVFEMRMTADLGMMPGLLGCADCFRSEGVKMYFIIKNGLLVCEEHMMTRLLYPSAWNVPVTGGMIEALRFACLSEMDRIFNFKVSDKAMAVLGTISERYLETQFDRHFRTLDFYKSVSDEPTPPPVLPDE
ncbi:MAG: DNA repair protein RecO [Huintestinicola sp.]